MRELELLAPAKNLEYGIAAIQHGADAVYIGASHHGARAAAGNSVEDIALLCEYAHSFRARVYVTINTLVYDGEMDGVVELVRQLASINVDAILVQDMGLAKIILEAPENDPLSHFKNRLHASTQTDNRTAEKVGWLHEAGFARVVLAREVSVDTMRGIHEQCPGTELEAFVHGALCVSFSGLCYASQHCFGRSANRGECAQFCRMKFDLVDNSGKCIERDKHLLSLKDMCQIENLGQMADAGICSFKIEGRLKDLAYVKNVVAAYSNELNRIVSSQPGKYRRASAGSCSYTFEPDLQKTFNRGYTTYFLHGRKPNISCPDSPKAMGKYIGTVKEIGHNSFNVSTLETLSNGDGLCFLDGEKGLVGFRANKVTGNRVYPFKMPESIAPGVKLYRNSDHAFEKLLETNTAERKISITMAMDVYGSEICLSASCPELEEAGGSGVLTVGEAIPNEFDKARKPQKDNIIAQLTKLGNTNYRCSGIEISQQAAELFIPSSRLAALRRDVTKKLDEEIADTAPSQPCAHQCAKLTEPSEEPRMPKFYAQGYLYNIANEHAKTFYKSKGMESTSPAYECSEPANAAIMQCKYCIRHALSYCVKNGGHKPTWQEPLFLVLGDGRRFRLEFSCAKCQMNVYASTK